MSGTTVGDDAFVLDGFGLTRIRAGKATTKPFTGNWLAQAGARLVLHDETAHGRFRVLNVERLTSTTKRKLELFHALPHPDGVHLLTRARAFQVHDGDGGLVAELADDDVASKPLGMLTLGRALAHRLPHVDRLAACDDEGTFATYDPPSGAFYFAVLRPVEQMLAAPSLVGRLLGRSRSLGGVSATIPAPSGSLYLRASRKRALLGVHEPSSGEAMALRFDAAGVHPLRRTSQGPIVLGPTWMAWQATPSTVHVEHDDGRVDIHTLPSGAHGDGELVASSGRLLFVTPDRESIVDVTGGHVLDRKLDARDREARAELMGFVAEANLRARPFDVRFAVETAVRTGSEGWRPRIRWTLGDLGLGAALHIGETVQAYVARWRPPAVSLTSALTPSGVGQVEAALRTFDGRPAGFVDALAHCASAFAGTIGSSSRWPARPIFAEGAGWHFLAAATAACEGEGELSRRSSTPFDLDRMVRAVEALPAREAGYGDEPRDGVAWAMVEVMGAEAWPTLVRWLVDVPTPHAAANLHIASRPLSRLVQLHPGIGDAVRARLNGIDDEPRAHRAREVLRQLSYDR